jgi:hypothetical protein
MAKTAKQMAAAKKNLQQKGQPSNSPGRPKGSGYGTFAQELFKDSLAHPTRYKNKTVPFVTAYMQEVQSSALKGGWAAKMFFERLFDDDILEKIDRELNKSKREDADFQSYRIYKLGHDYQQRVLSSMNKRIYNMAGRRAGKSETNILKAVDVMTSKDDGKVLIIGLTHTTTVDLYFNAVVKLIEELGWEIEKKSRTEGLIAIGEREIHFKGNSSIDEREKIRGTKWDVVIIDEVQSQKGLISLIDSIVEPTLLDRDGQLILTGTGPRVRGTYWETLWTQDNGALKLNWNITDNPFIPNYKEVLDKIKEDKGLTDTSPLYVREYLGQISYDDDALVYRLEDDNFIVEQEMLNWMATQPVTDVQFSAGLDYGFDDADGFAIVMYSISNPSRKYLVYEYKGRRTGVTELVDAIKAGIEYINTDPKFANLTNKDFNIFADTAGGIKKISFELSTQHNLPVLDAYKANKDFGIEQLQEDVRKRNFKVIKGGVFENEALKTIFKRDELDNLTRTVDDTAFHPDMLDAVLYALRPIYMFSNN